MSALVIVVTLVAGATGALLRYGVSAAFARMPARLPWAVLIVNVVGSLVGGIVLGLVQAGVISHDLRLILLTGFAGGLTTFSTLSVETIQLVMIGRWRSAVAERLRERGARCRGRAARLLRRLLARHSLTAPAPRRGASAARLCFLRWRFEVWGNGEVCPTRTD